MMDAVQAFLQANALAPSAFDAGSRYFGLATAQLQMSDGRTVVYLRRRFLPQTNVFAALQQVSIVTGDRLDTLAARHLGDAQASWRLCDANGAMQPEALVMNIGAMLAITLPEGVPGVLDAG